MKTWQVRERFGLDALTLTEQQTPTPRRGEVLVRVRAASVNYRDLAVVGGLYNPALPLPFVPLSDGAGEVAAVGEGVTRFRAGDRVVGAFHQGWLAGELTPEALAAGQLGSPLGGVLAEYVVLPEQGLVRAPEHLSFEEAATLPIAGVTAWSALFGDRPVRAGDTVLVQGTGGVAAFAIQLARAAGARVIVTSSSDAKLARDRELGATDGINYRTTPGWEERARELTGGRGPDLIVDIAGELARSVAAVRAGGQVTAVGFLAGAETPVQIVPLLVKDVRIEGVSVGSRAHFEALNRALEQHKIHPVVDRVFPFEQAREALAALREATHVGKLVIRVAA
jgi:NADPH:quinone reductase-like Zn-dependent oxidoreductase